MEDLGCHDCLQSCIPVAIQRQVLGPNGRPPRQYALGRFLEYYPHYRPHQGLDGAMLEPLPQEPDGQVERVDFLGGLLRGYRRAKLAA